jgi:nucleoside-diphosphate-sugar epimerase
VLIAVTGATGFVGDRLVERLANAGHQVYAYGRRPPGRFRLSALADYRVWDLTAGALSDPPAVDAVVHCAAAVTDWGAWRELYAANVLGTRYALTSFPTARQFIQLSSVSVYDPLVPKRRVREDAPLPSRYLNHYGLTKQLAEREVLTSGRPAVILRPHAIYGAGDNTLRPRLLRAHHFGRLLAVGDGRNLLSLTHVENLLDAILAALERPASSGIFNVADAVEASLDELLRAALTALGLPARIFYLPVSLAWSLATVLERAYLAGGARRAPPLTRYLVSQLANEQTLDLTRARNQLGYRPTRCFRDGFAELAARPI